MTIHRTAMIVAGLLLMAGSALAQADRVALVEDQKARAVLVLSAEPAAEEREAAEELAATIERITGARLAVATVGDSGLLPIYVGSAAPAEVTDAIRKQSDSDSALALWVEPKRVVVTGATPEATYFAACELLEQLGVRWFMPGELGTVIPKSPTAALDLQKTIQSPSFEARNMSIKPRQDEWTRHMRNGGTWFPSAHGVPGIHRNLFAEHPEYFALIDGERTVKQVCVSNPDVIRIVSEATRERFANNPDAQWIGMGPNDGGAFCECDNCRALDAGDYDPFSSSVSHTDRYIWFFNQVLAGLGDEFKDKKIGFYAYHTYMRPPLREKPDPRIVPALAPIALCRVHGPNNPLCPEKSYYGWLVKAWSDLVPEVYDRGYWFNLADPGFVFSMVHVLREQIPLAHELGIKGWRVECFSRFAPQNPALYIASKLMWDHTADVDALMRDFADKYYGPAREPMLAYHLLMDAALRDSDHHTGSAHDAPRHYPQALRAEARSYLDQAAQLAGDSGDYAKRVAVTRLSFDQLEAFIAMLESSAKLDFVTAKAALDRCDAIAQELRAIDPVLLDKYYSTYMSRFFRKPVEQGYARVTGGNTPVAGCDDTWAFLTDPTGVGEALGYFRPEQVGGNWQQITTSTSWSNQGLRYYRGVTWYRQRVTVPADFVGKRLFLWVGGADEKAKVWLNGHELGIVVSKFLPFELDATDDAVAGDNVITIAVVNDKVDELGTGGLTGPVLLYAPAAGPEAQLENLRPAADTFP